ncbi:MAG: radical SAM protein [Ruminococcus sp.]|nr:radical SAM protein [Ruminococcus sp.]
MAKIGLWSDCHNFPSLPLMKLSAYHKSIGDTVEHYMALEHYDLVYASKAFSFTPDIDDTSIVQAVEVRKGGTGYCISVQGGKETFDKGKDTPLAKEIEHIYPDYSLYPEYDYAAGFLTRGCPRNCDFCIVGKKEGRCSHQVAELSEFWRGQREIKLLDPNILACREHEKLLKQLAECGAKIDFTQGLDIRLTNPDNINLLNRIKSPMLHFAWDNPKEDLIEYFKRFSELTAVKSERNKSVYVLTNFNSSLDEDLYRIYSLRDLGYSPYVMIYQKEHAPKVIRRLQRWCNCRYIFRSTKSFAEYK